ncbi:MAG: PEP-CTERM sorting domain-containing protein [Pirellulales bacterium]
MPDPPALARGDYNDDGTVDAADYVTWRKNIGAPSLPNRDPTNTGPIGEPDYNTWRAHFGQSFTGSGSTSSSPLPTPHSPLASAVPEPSTFPLLITAGCGTSAFSRCFQARCKSRRLSRPARRNRLPPSN